MFLPLVLHIMEVLSLKEIIIWVRNMHLTVESYSNYYFE